VFNKPKKPEPCHQDDGSFQKMINSAGRVSLTSIQKLALALEPESFLQFIRKPVLAGSAIHQGNLEAQRGMPPREMNRTVLFEPVEYPDEFQSISDSLKNAIYPIIKGTHATTPSNLIFIGRIDTNDFIMPDNSISRQHAIIELKAEGYFLRDCNSSNGTFLHARRLEKKSVMLSDKDRVSFARYEFVYLTPESLFSTLSPQ
jgi:hypothetical protein